MTYLKAIGGKVKASSYDFCNIFNDITLGNLLKDTLLTLLKEPSIEKALLTFHITTETRFHLGSAKKEYAYSCQNVCDVLTFW